MDITDTTEQRFELGIDLFLEGHSLVYNGVVFWKDGKKTLHVNSYSDWEMENSTPQMAKEKIERAKAVMEALSEKSQKFSEISKNLPHEHYFCYDYGKGAVALAKEVNGEFTWLVPNKK